MFDRFSDRAKKTLSFARLEAIRLGHGAITPEHMLHGLLQEPGSTAARALERRRIDRAGILTALAAQAKPGRDFASGQLPFTPQAKRSLEFALEEAALLGNNVFGTEHLLLGLLRTPTPAADTLRAAGADLDGLREAVRDVQGNAPGHAERDRSKVRALLISNSTMHGGGYLEHCAAAIRDVLGPKRNVLFVPFALHDHAGYTQKARTAFSAMGHELTSVHEATDPLAAVAATDAVFVGGGNTFRLLKALQDRGLLAAIRERALGGMPYIGSSAGTGVATLSIRTTNDMPIVQPTSFTALQLVPFQINAHYLDPDPHSTHMGETREERLRQFHEEHATPVLGLREGCMLRVEGPRAELLGTTRARLFLRGKAPQEFTPPCDLSFLLQAAFA